MRSGGQGKEARPVATTGNGRRWQNQQSSSSKDAGAHNATDRRVAPSPHPDFVSNKPFGAGTERDDQPLAFARQRFSRRPWREKPKRSGKGREIIAKTAEEDHRDAAAAAVPAAAPYLRALQSTKSASAPTADAAHTPPQAEATALSPPPPPPEPQGSKEVMALRRLWAPPCPSDSHAQRWKQLSAELCVNSDNDNTQTLLPVPAETRPTAEAAWHAVLRAGVLTPPSSPCCDTLDTGNQHQKRSQSPSKDGSGDAADWWHAVFADDSVTVDKLLRRGIRWDLPLSPAAAILVARPEASSAVGQTALHIFAARRSGLACLQTLLRCGAATHVDLRDRGHKRSALSVACAAGNLDAVRLLLQANADINSRDKGGDTALHHAVAQRQSAVATLLLKRPQLRINSRNKKGETPLLVTRDPQICAALLAAGADVHARDAQGRDALHTAVDRGAHALLHRLLHVNGCAVLGQESLHNALLAAIALRDESAALMLLSRPEMRVLPTLLGAESALLRACDYGLIAVCIQLLMAGAALETCNADGLNVLGLAALRGHRALLLPLLRRAADPIARRRLLKDAEDGIRTCQLALTQRWMMRRSCDTKQRAVSIFFLLLMGAPLDHCSLQLLLGKHMEYMAPDGYIDNWCSLRCGSAFHRDYCMRRRHELWLVVEAKDGIDAKSGIDLAKEALVEVQLRDGAMTVAHCVLRRVSVVFDGLLSLPHDGNDLCLDLGDVSCASFTVIAAFATRGIDMTADLDIAELSDLLIVCDEYAIEDLFRICQQRCEQLDAESDTAGPGQTQVCECDATTCVTHTLSCVDFAALFDCLWAQAQADVAVGIRYRQLRVFCEYERLIHLQFHSCGCRCAQKHRPSHGLRRAYRSWSFINLEPLKLMTNTDPVTWAKLCDYLTYVSHQLYLFARAQREGGDTVVSHASTVFYVDGALISLRSGRFRAWLSWNAGVGDREMRLSSEDPITHDELLLILLYCYTGFLPIRDFSWTELTRLLQLCHEFDLPFAFWYIEKRLMNCLTVDNALELFDTARWYERRRLAIPAGVFALSSVVETPNIDDLRVRFTAEEDNVYLDVLDYLLTLDVVDSDAS